MYKLLIAEDELWLRKRLVTTVDWEQFGISEVYEAEDGEEALMLAASVEPDILITDINMPELSGIDLIRSLNESSFYLKTIIISGYDEFEYAQSAIQMKVSDYLLKPIDPEELKATVKKCISEIEKERFNNEIYRKHVETTQILTEKLYEDLILGDINPDEHSLSMMENMGIPFPAQRALVVVVHMSTNSYLRQGEQKIDVSVNQHFAEDKLKSEIQKEFSHSYFFENSNQMIMLLFSDLEDGSFQQKVESCFQKVSKQLYVEAPVRMFYVMGKIAEDLSGIRFSYEETLSHSWIAVGTEKEEPGSSLLSTENTFSDFEDVYAEYNLKGLVTAVRSGDVEASDFQLKQLLQMFYARLDNSVSTLKLQLFYTNVLNYITRSCLAECGSSDERLLTLCVKCIHNTSAVTSFGAMERKLYELVETTAVIYGENDGNRRHWLFDQIIAYIEENYNTSISTRDVAKRFFLNVSYFCKIFHEETGFTFTNYLINLRMEKAKIFLSTTNLKLYEIAERVGYTNVQYFSTIFKGKEGISPSQYRQLRTSVKE